MARRARNDYRRMAYRPPLEEEGTGPRRASAVATYLRFVAQYLAPHRGAVAACVLLVSLNACSVYLMAYYGRIVVDRILVVTPPAAAVAAPVRGIAAGDRAPSGQRLALEAAAPLNGRMSDAYRRVQANPRPSNAMTGLMALFGVYLATLLALNGAARAAERLRIRVSQQLTARLREDMHRKILSLSQLYHQRHTPGRLLARILSDVNVVQSQLMRTIVDSGSQIVMFVAGVALLAVLDWRVACFALCAMVPYSLTIQRVRGRLRTINRELRHSNSWLWSLATQKLDSVKAIFAYGRERQERLNFHRLSAALLRDTLQQQRLGAGVNRTAQIISATTTTLIFLHGTREVLAGSTTLGKMMFLYGTAANLFTPVMGLTQMSLVISSLLVVMQRLVQVLDEPLEIRDEPEAVEFPAPLHSGLTMTDVDFAYAPDAEPVLRDIQLEVAAGDWLCIMGPSGSGKSTLLSLLARLYDPTAGRILVDGIPLAHIRLASLRRHVAFVPQEAQTFSGTVRDNITYGDPEAGPSAIVAAAQAAECHDFIMELPVRYETTIGEKGTTLSGGQRQRLSLARALLTQPDVLLLDDCTSALDADTERRIQETLTRLMKGKTAVIVSQRVSMAMRCDRVCVLQEGRIREAGTAAQLLSRDGFFARLHAQQTR